MVTASATCLSVETKISWNQVGPAGPQGPAGGNQHLTVSLVSTAPITLAPNNRSFEYVSCPASTFAVGGSVFILNPSNQNTVFTNEEVVYNNAEFGDGTIAYSSSEWQVYAENLSTTDDMIFQLFADCLTLS
jgi:hypothetical protein